MNVATSAYVWRLADSQRLPRLLNVNLHPLNLKLHPPGVLLRFATRFPLRASVPLCEYLIVRSNLVAKV